MTTHLESTDQPPSTHAPARRQRRGAGAPMALVRSMSLIVIAMAAWPLLTASTPAEPVDILPPLPVATVEAAVFPDTLNGRVEHWLKQFTGRYRDDFQIHLTRRGRYEGMIRSRLRERGMPEDLIWLAMIESGFNPTVRSSASAIGLWQFMDATARQYGLRVDRWVDERRDPVAATDAALDYLHWLHARYDSWYLAAAAYNGGPGRVSRILESHADGRTGEEALYWEVIDQLPRETRNYVPKLLAARRLATSPWLYGFHSGTEAAYEYDTIEVAGGVALTSLARSMGVPVETLRGLNPHLIRDMTPPGKSWEVRVPDGGGRIAALRIAQAADRVATSE